MVELTYTNLERIYLETFCTPTQDQAAATSQFRTIGYASTGINADLNEQGDYRVHRLGLLYIALNGTVGIPNQDWAIQNFAIRAFLETQTGLYTPVKGIAPSHVTFSDHCKEIVLPVPTKITRLQQSTIQATVPGYGNIDAQFKLVWFFDLQRMT